MAPRTTARTAGGGTTRTSSGASAPAGGAAPTAAAPTAYVPAAAARPLRADAQRNLERILAATRAMAAENADEIVMERVAERAGIGIGTLYRRFPTRLALLEAAYADEVALLVTRAQELSLRLEPVDALATWGHEVGRYASTKKALLREQQDADAQTSATISTYREKLASAARTLLERAQQAGQIRTDVDPSDLLRMLVGCAMICSDDPAQRDRIIGVALDGLRT